MSDSKAILDAIGQLPDGEIDLADAALQLARLAVPEADWRAASAHLSEIARDAVALGLDVPDDDLAARAGALAGLMAGRYGYIGDGETYDDFDNANLIRVIERRRGLPVALGILWLHAARAAGWAARGINFPGHFLIALEADTKQGTALVAMDVFAGGEALDRDDLRNLLKRSQGSRAEMGPTTLAPMSNRDILLRLQTNIKSRLLQIGQFASALSYIEDMLRIAPDAAVLWQEAGQLNRRLDHYAASLRCYERFLALRPSGEAASRARAAITELRGRLN